MQKYVLHLMHKREGEKERGIGKREDLQLREIGKAKFYTRYHMYHDLHMKKRKKNLIGGNM